MEIVKEIKKQVISYTCDGCGCPIKDNNRGQFNFDMRHNTRPYDDENSLGFEMTIAGDYCRTCMRIFVEAFLKAVKDFPERYDNDRDKKEKELFEKSKSDPEIQKAIKNEDDEW